MGNDNKFDKTAENEGNERIELTSEELTSVVGGINIDGIVRALGPSLYTAPTLRKAKELYLAGDTKGFVSEIVNLISQGSQLARKAMPYLR